MYETSRGKKITIRNTEPPYQIGDKTGSGWKVATIQYFYKSRFYLYDDYRKAVSQTMYKKRKREERKRKVKRILDDIFR